MTWSKSIATRIVKARANDRCELCRSQPVDMAHRVDASDGGPWAPANLVALCRRCHDWTHHWPLMASDAGWRLESTADYLTAPVFLWTEIGFRWVLLNNEGEYLNHDIVPVLPPWVPYAQ